ncbi:hypothetical protein [Magnetospirillum sp. UT-4]|uniref:hypothetical protein n=1 Tax=Magnetospirillum sp. UT-4 TaxID=2681467 RepID=UPI0013849108|nr:hypothetical protein [Magnetospirillum sp. UT-4]CAA7621187.1 conserved hypothetical protein [Magnetospirillum sp. UT-4]
MAKAPVQVFGFPYGQLDPELVARPDLKLYYLGGKTVLNMAPRAGGGLDRRPGLAFDAELADAAAGARLEEFEGDSGAYLIVFTNLKVHVFAGGVKTWEGATPYTAAQLEDLDWAQGEDTMILFHPDHEPRKLVRQGADDNWAVSTLAFKNPPSHQFGVDTTGSATPSAKSGSVTVTSSATDFASADVGWTVDLGSGHGTITAKASSASVTVNLVDDLKDTTAVPAGDWVIQEPAWSTARGWPGCGTFHEDRLFIAGAKSRKRTVWGSRSGYYFDFKWTDEALDDEAVEVTLLDKRANHVRRLYSAQKLFALTTGGPFVFVESPITPGNFFAKRQGEIGASKIRPAELDGVVVYVSDGADGAHMSVFELVPNDLADAYTLNDVAEFAASLVRRPVDLAARRGTDRNSAAYLFVINEDGTAGVLHSRRSQKVTAWTLWQTAGQMLSTAVVGNTCYCLVKRTIAGATRYFIEHFDADHLGDCSKRLTAGAPQTVWSGLGHLEGHEVHVVADGAAAGRFVVTGGAVTLPEPASVVEVGLPFSWKVETMPIEAQLQDGTLVGKNARLYRAVVKVMDTSEMWVEGQLQVFRRFGAAHFDAPAPRFTGEVPVRLLGRGRSRTVTVEGHGMSPATILSITAFVAD